MTGLHVVLVLALVTLPPQPSASPQAPDATTWPIPGVLVPGTSGVTPPRLVKGSTRTISVFCSVLHAANTSDADKAQEIRRAGAEFGAMLKRIAFHTR